MPNQIDQLIDEAKAEFEKRSAVIQEEGARRISDIKQDDPDPNGAEATVNGTFDVKFEVTAVRFDIPKFSTETQKIIFGIPTTKMETKTISWNEPATKMVPRCLTKIPKITCGGSSIKWRNGRPQVIAGKCTTEMVCVWTDVPEVYMKLREIKIDIPEITVKNKEISFNKPVITLDTVEIKIKLPQFYLRKLDAQFAEQERQYNDVGKDMESDINEAAGVMNDKIIKAVSKDIDNQFEDSRNQMLTERKNVSAQFEDGINMMKTTIKVLKENNAFDEVKRLESELSKLVDDYSKALSDMDAAVDDLNQKQKEALNQVDVKVN